MRGGTLCSAHAGRVRAARRPPQEIAEAPTPQPRDLELPTLESEISLLAARRNTVDDWLQKRMAEENCNTAEALRYLAVLSQVGKSLATMLVQRASTTGAAEIERFFEAVAERVRELTPANVEASEREPAPQKPEDTTVS